MLSSEKSQIYSTFLVPEACDLSKEFFISKFNKAKEIMIQDGIELTSTHIGSGEQAQNYLASIFKNTV